MKSIKISEFKEKCLTLVEQLEAEGLVITKHGKAIAKIIPIDNSMKSLIGSMKDKLTIKGDIFSTGTDWDAQS